MSEEILRFYGGLVEISRGGRYEIHEEGAMLAATESRALADKLFFKRALDAAAERAGQGGRCRMTAKGREVYLADGETEETEQASSRRKKKNRPFIPPTVEQVMAYCLERGKSIDAEEFVDHYTANGWMAGRVKMKDWKAAVRTWERKEYQTFGNPVRKRGAALTNPEESSLDLQAYDEQLMRHTPKFEAKEKRA